ncbi:MAG TPA: sigma-70 family RNA polymerase sigma factor [Gemmataceae bacterium]|nr:sigma-70 family RNA polymerase sigma factor [Gemmataceae bacterium]
MASRSLDSAFQRLRFAVGGHDEVGLPDARLLADFINRRSEESFAFLVRRHARMVMGVCLRVARHRQDAEDAFQATFLVLVRKAAAIAQPELLANWLYRVAHNTALKVNAEARKRRLREEPLTPMAEPSSKEPPHYLLAALDQELSRLPSKYRVPIILCDLEGKTQRKAAQLLGCPEKTLSSRLIRARDMLAKRLTRLGLAVSGGALLSTLTQIAACASPTLIGATVKAAALLGGNAAAGGVISTNVAVLMEGVIKAMFIQKLKLVGVVVLALGLAGYGGGKLVLATGAAQEGHTGTVAQEKKDDGGAGKKKDTPIATPATTEKKDTAAQNETYVHRVLYRRARDVVNNVRSFYTRDPNTGQPYRPEWITANDRTNSVIVNGNPNKIAEVKRILADFDSRGNAPFQLPFPRTSPRTLDEVAAELKNARLLLAQSEGDWKIAAELPKMQKKEPELTLTERMVKRESPDNFRIRVAGCRIYVEMLVVLDLRLRELDQAQAKFKQGALPISHVEAAARAVAIVTQDLERFDGF